MKDLFYYLLMLLALMGCQKSDPAEQPALDQALSTIIINTPEDEVKYSLLFSGRSGLLLPMFDFEKMATDNFILAGVAGYQNEQYLFDKDSIVDTEIINTGSDHVNIGGSLHVPTYVKVNFTNGSSSHEIPDFPKLFYVKDGMDALYVATGINYGKGVQTWMKFTRSSRRMNYYDYTFGRFKNKYGYQVTNPKTSYFDYIPSRLQTSTVFRLLN